MIYQILALVIATCFYGAYFYKQIQLRKKGIATNRLAKGRKPKRTTQIETALLIATYGTVVIQYASVFFSAYLFPLAFPSVARSIGLVIAACGAAFFVLAIVTMQDNWRAGVDESQKTSIVTKGIYRYSRNPAFVGFDLLYIGLAVALPNILIVFAAVFAFVLLHLQILEEEKYLPNVFGNEYEQYKKQTPRYLLF
jgi:protein-S-isoprenylcysteine O-methyltransferase Ste14